MVAQEIRKKCVTLSVYPRAVIILKHIGPKLPTGPNADQTAMLQSTKQREHRSAFKPRPFRLAITEFPDHREELIVQIAELEELLAEATDGIDDLSATHAAELESLLMEKLQRLREYDVG